MSTSVNTVLTEAENVFKTLIWDPMIIAGEALLEVDVPFLALPVVKQLDEAAIKALTDALFNQFIIFIDVTAIKLVNAELQTKWTTASESLAIIAAEQGATSDAYKTALADAAADFAVWVRTDPH